MTRQEARELLQHLAPILTPTGYRVAAMLALHTNGVNDCWVSIETLAVETGASERSVQRALRYLEAQGAVDTQPRVGQTSMYTILPLGRGDKALSPGGDTQVSPISEKPPTLLGPQGSLHGHESPAHAQGGVPSVVAAYVEEARRCGITLDPRSAPRIGRDAKQLLGTFPLEDLQAAARIVARKKLSPATLGQVAQNGEYGGKADNVTKAIEEAKAWKPKRRAR